MALSFGFYNSINSDRTYDAIQFGQIFDGIIKDGIYATYEKAMVVIASENAGEVIIQPGRAWFNHTWSYNDANLIISAPEPDILLERIDALVLDVNTELAFRENSFKWVEGTASSRPERPNLTNTVTHHQYPLCYIHRYPETTMIYTRDITNMVGTSECPFVTGVLTGLDIDMWINQWDDEFHTWETATRTQFEAWMVNQQEVYTAWFNSVRSEMEDNMTEFEAWFETIRGIIDEEAATHLQAEIDALAEMLPAGSHIDIHTTETTLYNRNVTVSDQAGHSKTVKFSAAGDATVESFPYVGLLDFTSTDGVQTANASITTPYFGRYALTMAFWAATCNLVSDETFAGIVVTVTDSLGDVKGAVTLDSEGSGVFTATYPDTYTFTLTYGGETMEVSLAVTQETTYEVELHGGFRFDQWLVAGRVEEEFDTLDEILEDEKTLRQLFLVHDAVDYMCDTYHDTQKVNEDYTKIFTCDLAAKWINLFDYALDKLSANEGIKAIMDAADKYGYGEWTLVGQVPAMASNTTPVGEVIYSNPYNASYGTNAYKVFNENLSETNLNWADPDNSTNSSIGYHFSNSVVIKGYYIKFDNANTFRGATEFTIEASNDGTDWVEIYRKYNTEQNTIISENIPNNTPYSYYRINKITGAPSKNIMYINGLQFYDYGPKGNVPIMTSDTAPYGTVAVSDYYQSQKGYYAFDGVGTTSWATNGSAGNKYIEYKFVNPVCIKRLYWYLQLATMSRINSSVVLTGSNDGSNWSSALVTIERENVTEITDVKVPNDTYYLYYRLSFTATSGTVNFITLQFYGRELSVSVPVMTSDTAPYGEASASNENRQSGGTIDSAFKAFDGSTSTYWRHNTSQAGSATDPWLAYHFTLPVCIRKIRLQNPSDVDQQVEHFIIQASNDGENWTNISEELTNPSTRAQITDYEFANANEYSYYRVFVTSTYTSGLAAIAELQFFGVDYSEKEFEPGTTKKWLYDHGLLLNGLTLYKGNQTTSSKPVIKNDELVCGPLKGTESWNNYSCAAVNIDLLPHSLFRAKVGRYASGSTNSEVGRLLILDYISDGATLSAGSSYNVSELNTPIKSPNTVSLNVATYYEQKAVIASVIFNNNRLTSYKELWLE